LVGAGDLPDDDDDEQWFVSATVGPARTIEGKAGASECRPTLAPPGDLHRVREQVLIDGDGAAHRFRPKRGAV
jgi:hypothetical protein